MEETKGAQAYRLVQEYIKKNPSQTVGQAVKALEIPASNYYSYFKSRAYKDSDKTPKTIIKRRRKPTKLETFLVPDTPKSDYITLLVVPTEKIQQVLKEVWK